MSNLRDEFAKCVREFRYACWRFEHHRTVRAGTTANEALLQVIDVAQLLQKQISRELKLAVNLTAIKELDELLRIEENRKPQDPTDE